MSTDVTPDVTSDPHDGVRESAPTSFSDGFHADAGRLVRRYPVARSALLPLLHLVQSEHGYVSPAGVAECARRLDLTKAEVGAVATFYTMYKREPVGDWLLSVCTNPTCQIAGGQVIFDRYKDALDGRVRDPETKVTIEQAECLGICDAAPVVQVNYDMYGPLTDDEADRLLSGCRSGEPPVSSWSGEPAPTFADVERELSGANDTFGDALVDAARHSITGYDVPPSSRTGETDIPVTHPGGDRAGHGGEIFLAGFVGTNGSGPDGDPEVAEAPVQQDEPDHDDQNLTADQQDDASAVAEAAEDNAQPGPDVDGGEPADVADDADQARAASDTEAGANPSMSTDEAGLTATPGSGDDDTSPDEVDAADDAGDAGGA